MKPAREQVEVAINKLKTSFGVDENVTTIKIPAACSSYATARGGEEISIRLIKTVKWFSDKTAWQMRAGCSADKSLMAYSISRLI